MQETKEKGLEEPNPNPVSNRLYEQSKYLYYIATQLNEIITLLKNQEAEEKDEQLIARLLNTNLEEEFETTFSYKEEIK